MPTINPSAASLVTPRADALIMSIVIHPIAASPVTPRTRAASYTFASFDDLLAKVKAKIERNRAAGIMPYYPGVLSRPVIANPGGVEGVIVVTPAVSEPVLFVVGGQTSPPAPTPTGIWRTTDFTGASWADVTPASWDNLNDAYDDVSMDGDQVVAVGTRIDYSTDRGVTFHPTNITSGMFGINNGLIHQYSNRNIAWSPTRVVVCGSDPNTFDYLIAWADRSDLSNWTIVDLSTLNYPSTSSPIGIGQVGAIAYGNGVFMATSANDALLFTSLDGGATWQVAIYAFPVYGIGAFSGMAFGGGQFLSFSANGVGSPSQMQVATSPDGVAITITSVGTEYVDLPHLPDIGQWPDGLDYHPSLGKWVAWEDGRERLWTVADPTTHWVPNPPGFFDDLGMYLSNLVGSEYFVTGARFGNAWSAASPDATWTEIEVGGLPLGLVYGKQGAGLISVGGPTNATFSNPSGAVSLDDGVTWNPLTGTFESWLEDGHLHNARMFT
jgi:hypothetical protein